MEEVLEKGYVIDKEAKCYHCGDACGAHSIVYDQKSFCCAGCKSVYQIFDDNGLLDVYQDTLKVRPGQNGKYEFLQNEAIASGLFSFVSDTHNVIVLKLPAIHCSSCIYLLENLPKLDPAVLRVSVNFIKKTAEVHFDPSRLSLKELATLLDTIGYAPDFSLNLSENSSKPASDLAIRIGVAAFCFGNIMLLSFPEYLGFEETMDVGFGRFFSYINLLLTLPVVIYSARDYLVSAFKGLKNRFVTIDIPIALGIITLFGRSTYEIISQSGPGYADSLAGLVFFLLIGKWFQNKTYQNLTFDRDYKSYFPLAARVEKNGRVGSVPIAALHPGDRIYIRNQEIIPADAELLSDKASIDYSFVTGETTPVDVKQGDTIYAGGKQLGEQLKLKVVKASSQSYLTGLWNNQIFNKTTTTESEALINRISKHFTIAVLGIATIATTYWAFVDAEVMWSVFTAVLIVACPCALALAAPFTNGNALRIFGRNKLYLRQAGVAERLAGINTIVFDKTGTLTSAKEGHIKYYGSCLSSVHTRVLKKMASNSTHPLSKQISAYLKGDDLKLSRFKEVVGAGLEAVYNNKIYRLGSARFLNASEESARGKVYWSINGEPQGYFMVENQFRPGLKHMVDQLSPHYKLIVLSGDNEQEKQRLQSIFPLNTKMYFHRQPQGKLDFVNNLQQQKQKILMLGDGLNDAGALKQSNVGIAVTEDIAAFSPACEGIMEGGVLNKLPQFLRYARQSRHVIIASFIISFAYNIIGLGFAVAGALTPIFAAILMPVSSISVVCFTTLSGNFLAKKQSL